MLENPKTKNHVILGGHVKPKDCDLFHWHPSSLICCIKFENLLEIINNSKGGPNLVFENEGVTNI